MRRRGFLIAGIVCIILGAILFVLARMNEDTWIQDSGGIWVKHGMPSQTPSYVTEQQDAINCASGLFNGFNGTINSQCIGTCGNYSADIVHVPRTADDNLSENQCQDFIAGKTSHFIELDKEGNVVRAA
jgi:hypothetical protein